MNSPIHLIYDFLNSYNLSTTKLHLALTPEGQVHLCTGQLKRPPYKKHHKLIKQKFAEILVAQDFRFTGCKLEFTENKFIVGNAENIGQQENIFVQAEAGVYQYNNVYENR
jgi:hypothetical protein